MLQSAWQSHPLATSSVPINRHQVCGHAGYGCTAKIVLVLICFLLFGSQEEQHYSEEEH